MDTSLLQAQAELWNLTFGFFKTMSLKCALDLGIPDAINDNGEALTLSQLHSVLSLPPSKKPHLHRLMRLLTHFGFFIVTSTGAGIEPAYGLTAQSRLVIQKDESINMLQFIRFHVDNILVKPSQYMGDWFMQDSKDYPAHGCTFWDLASKDPEVNKLFHDAMISGSCSLVDVGGGKGAMAKLIAKNFPHVRSTVLDLPHVVSDSPDDGIVKWVLHDWSNENCVRILQRCKDAIPSREGGKVIVLETVVGLTSAGVSTEPQLFYDMLMLTVVEGKERDENQWKSLFIEAGLSSYKITHTFGFFSIIEVYP